MRYIPSEEVVFIHVDYTPASLRFSSKYYPWEDKLNGITLSKMTCVEHHRVPGDWDDVIQYDGFIFVDKHDRRWNNQYPRASYSQISTAQDYVVRSCIDKEFKKMTDLASYLDDVSGGIRSLGQELAKATSTVVKAEIAVFITSLKAHFEEVRLKLIKEFDLEAVEEEHENLPGFYSITIQKVKETQRSLIGDPSLKGKTIYVTQGGGRAIRDRDGYIFVEAPPNQHFMVGQHVPAEWGVHPLENKDTIEREDVLNPDD